MLLSCRVCFAASLARNRTDVAFDFRAWVVAVPGRRAQAVPCMQQRATREPEPQGQLSVSVHGMGRTATKIASAPTSRAVSLIRYPMNSLPRPDIGEGMTAVAPGALTCVQVCTAAQRKPVMACSGSRRPRGFHIQQSTYPRGRGHASDVCTKRPRCAAGTDLRQRARPTVTQLSTHRRDLDLFQFQSQRCRVHVQV